MSLLVSLVTTLIILLTCSKRLRSGLKNHSQALQTFGAYLAGLAVAAAVRLAKGPLHLGDFYQLGIPIIAGFVVAIVFQQTRGSGIGKADILAREVTVVYLLAGAVSPMFGLFYGRGFSYLVFYAAICGSLGSSCYALIRAARLPDGSTPPTAPSDLRTKVAQLGTRAPAIPSIATTAWRGHPRAVVPTESVIVTRA
ncbi:MAG TPA: hypothetical protein VLX31_06140 [Streptosporangiaceae bacterium]|nr:hypothetical protein [Streptosporangiaceae bacterium]